MEYSAVLDIKIYYDILPDSNDKLNSEKQKYSNAYHTE